MATCLATVERFADLDVEVRDLIAGLTDTDPDDAGLSQRAIGDAVALPHQRVHQIIRG